MLCIDDLRVVRRLPLERLKQIASLKGFEMAPMLLDGPHETQREAVVIMADTSHSKGGQIFYNPVREKLRSRDLHD